MNALPHKHAHVPERTCVACRTKSAKRSLLRVAVADGALTLDTGQRLPGRGAYVHPAVKCIDVAFERRALLRSLGGHAVTPDKELFLRYLEKRQS